MSQYSAFLTDELSCTEEEKQSQLLFDCISNLTNALRVYISYKMNYLSDNALNLQNLNKLIATVKLKSTDLLYKKISYYYNFINFIVIYEVNPLSYAIQSYSKAQKGGPNKNQNLRVFGVKSTTYKVITGWMSHFNELSTETQDILSKLDYKDLEQVESIDSKLWVKIKGKYLNKRIAWKKWILPSNEQNIKDIGNALKLKLVELNISNLKTINISSSKIIEQLLHILLVHTETKDKLLFLKVHKSKQLVSSIEIKNETNIICIDNIKFAKIFDESSKYQIVLGNNIDLK